MITAVDTNVLLDVFGADQTFSVPTGEAAAHAGLAWRSYRKAGDPRTRVAADFLIGAYALVQTDRLLTRDRGFYRRYFAELAVLDPTA